MWMMVAFSHSVARKRWPRIGREFLRSQCEAVYGPTCLTPHSCLRQPSRHPLYHDSPPCMEQVTFTGHPWSVLDFAQNLILPRIWLVKKSIPYFSEHCAGWYECLLQSVCLEVDMNWIKEEDEKEKRPNVASLFSVQSRTWEISFAMSQERCQTSEITTPWMSSAVCQGAKVSVKVISPANRWSISTLFLAFGNLWNLGSVWAAANLSSTTPWPLPLPFIPFLAILTILSADLSALLSLLALRGPAFWANFSLLLVPSLLDFIPPPPVCIQVLLEAFKLLILELECRFERKADEGERLLSRRLTFN